jgi:hypothetical protein
MLNLLLMEWVTKMKTGSNSVEDHPQLSHNRHPSSRWCTGGCWFTVALEGNVGCQITFFQVIFILDLYAHALNF